MARHRRRTLAVGLGVALVVLLAIGIGTAAASKSSKSVVSPLRKACGAKLVVQTDWFPEPEHGFIYQLAGTNGATDTKKGHYTGTIKGTGVQLEIRAGGPFTGFQQPISQIYQDSSINIAYATSDEQIQLAKKLPLVSIVAPDEFSRKSILAAAAVVVGRIADAAWCYPEPLEGVGAIRGHLCFAAEGIDIWVDGVPLAH